MDTVSLAIEIGAGLAVSPACWYFSPPRGWTIKHATRKRVDYNKIGELEMEIYGHTFTGDAPDDPPRIQRIKEEAKERRALAEQSERLLREQAAWNPGPQNHAPLYPGDPNWTDEDGRPW